MLLTRVHVTDYKSINDSSPVDIEEDVTCLVGKNESGKTAFLEALYRLNPLEGSDTTFNALRDYPRSRHNEDRATIPNRNPISVVFSLENADVEALSEELGVDSLASHDVTVRRNYANRLSFDVKLNEAAIVKHLLASNGLDAALANNCSTLEQFVEKLGSLKDTSEPLATFRSEVSKIDLAKLATEKLEALLPKFLYFDNYSTLPGVFSIPYIQGRKREQLNSHESTAKALLELAGVDTAEFTIAEYETRRAALEAAALQVSKQAFKYWKQNKQLRVYFDSDFQKAASGERTPPWLQVRIENLRHGMTLNFEERSTGFVWFFSFFTYFSYYRKAKHKLIILLDEPGLSLHAAGQEDLLEMIDKELPKHQVIYTTHSPFMIRANQLQRARTVEDIDDVGTVISKEVFRNKKETIFPLQAALGYSMAQTLFIGPDNIILEGPSDMIYLQVLSDLLKQQGREGLDNRWTLVPAGGVEKVPAFIALYGNQLNVAVLLDAVVGGNQRVKSMIDHGLLEPNKLVSIAEFTKKKESDVEDLFNEDFYLLLLSASGEAAIDKAKLTPGPRILKRVETLLGRSVNHLRPASHLLTNQPTLLAQIDAATLDRFEALFKRLQPLLSQVKSKN